MYFKSRSVLYSMPAKVPSHPLYLETVAAIFINMVSRYSKLDMFYRMRPFTVPPGEKLRS